MYEIINLLDYHKLVSILGPPGIGKTSLARNLANYVKDRKKFSDGIIYVALRGCEGRRTRRSARTTGRCGRPARWRWRGASAAWADPWLPWGNLR